MVLLLDLSLESAKCAKKEEALLDSFDGRRHEMVTTKRTDGRTAS